MNSMMQEDKKLLLQDLCARSPYGVKITDGLNVIKADPFISIGVFVYDGKWKPYLRPMSSMTEEEYNSVDWNECQHTISYDGDGFHFKSIKTFTLEVFIWLNKNHFDYLTDDNNETLIDKGLAIDCTGLNIY